MTQLGIAYTRYTLWVLRDVYLSTDQRAPQTYMSNRPGKGPGNLAPRGSSSNCESASTQAERVPPGMVTAQYDKQTSVFDSLQSQDTSNVTIPRFAEENRSIRPACSVLTGPLDRCPVLSGIHTEERPLSASSRPVDSRPIYELSRDRPFHSHSYSGSPPVSQTEEEIRRNLNRPRLTPEQQHESWRHVRKQLDAQFERRGEGRWIFPKPPSEHAAMKQMPSEDKDGSRRTSR